MKPQWQTRPHQSWSSKQDGDLSALYICLLFQHTCMPGQIGTFYVNRAEEESSLLYGLPVNSWEFTPMFACKLLFWLISLKQQRSSSQRRGEIPFSQQKLIARQLRAKQSEGEALRHQATQGHGTEIMVLIIFLSFLSVCRPYIKVYQGMQAVYSSGI